MGMLLGCGSGLYRWRGGWIREKSPLHRADLVCQAAGHVAAVDNRAHLLSLGGMVLPCPRDVEALTLWQGCALALSSDTDCLSLAHPEEGWICTAPAGVYPQDMALWGDMALVCGGADGLVHALTLPHMHTAATFPLPGMPERLCVTGNEACALTLLPGEEATTAVVRLDLLTGACGECARLPGLPGAVCTHEGGLWLAAGDQLQHRIHPGDDPDAVFEGFGLIRQLSAKGRAVMATDALEDACILVCAEPRPSVQTLWRGDACMGCFTD